MEWGRFETPVRFVITKGPNREISLYFLLTFCQTGYEGKKLQWGQTKNLTGVLIFPNNGCEWDNGLSRESKIGGGSTPYVSLPGKPIVPLTTIFYIASCLNWIGR